MSAAPATIATRHRHSTTSPATLTDTTSPSRLMPSTMPTTGSAAAIGGSE